MHRRGFTIVELIVVITIMSILLVLGVVNVRGSQANARDSEREADIRNIALNLESFYNSGNDSSTTYGYYPSVDMIGNEKTYLRDIDPNSLAVPGAAVDSFGVPISSLVAATNTVETTAGVTPYASTNSYIYQPFKADDTLCTGTQECRRFNLYYYKETAAGVIVKSKHQ